MCKGLGECASHPRVPDSSALSLARAPRAHQGHVERLPLHAGELVLLGLRQNGGRFGGFFLNELIELLESLSPLVRRKGATPSATDQVRHFLFELRMQAGKRGLLLLREGQLFDDRRVFQGAWADGLDADFAQPGLLRLVEKGRQLCIELIGDLLQGCLPLRGFVFAVRLAARRDRCGLSAGRCGFLPGNPRTGC